MSCTSRAIRSRSSTTARSTSRSRSSAIRCANSCASRVRSRSLRIASPISTAVDADRDTAERSAPAPGLSSPVMRHRRRHHRPGVRGERDRHPLRAEDRRPAAEHEADQHRQGSPGSRAPARRPRTAARRRPPRADARAARPSARRRRPRAGRRAGRARGRPASGPTCRAAAPRAPRAVASAVQSRSARRGTRPSVAPPALGSSS